MFYIYTFIVICVLKYSNILGEMLILMNLLIINLLRSFHNVAFNVIKPCICRDQY